MEGFICKWKLYIADGRTGDKIYNIFLQEILLTVTRELVLKVNVVFTKQNTPLFSNRKCISADSESNTIQQDVHLVQMSACTGYISWTTG